MLERLDLKTVIRGLGLLAVCAAALWGVGEAADWKWTQAWMPNIGTESVSILVTVAIVDAIVRREGAAERAPVLQIAANRLSGLVGMFALGCAIQYVRRASAHVAVPQSYAGAVGVWIDTLDDESLVRAEWLKREAQMFRTLAEDLERHRARYAADVTHSTRAKIDNLVDNATEVAALLSIRETLGETLTPDATRDSIRVGLDAFYELIHQLETEGLSVDFGEQHRWMIEQTRGTPEPYDVEGELG